MNILLMMLANLVGFVIGTDGIRFFVKQLFGTLEGVCFYRYFNFVGIKPRLTITRFAIPHSGVLLHVRRCTAHVRVSVGPMFLNMNGWLTSPPLIA